MRRCANFKTERWVQLQRRLRSRTLYARVRGRVGTYRVVPGGSCSHQQFSVTTCYYYPAYLLVITSYLLPYYLILFFTTHHHYLTSLEYILCIGCEKARPGRGPGPPSRRGNSQRLLAD